MPSIKAKHRDFVAGGLNPKWWGVACMVLMILALAGLLIGAVGR